MADGGNRAVPAQEEKALGPNLRISRRDSKIGKRVGGNNHSYKLQHSGVKTYAKLKRDHVIKALSYINGQVHLASGLPAQVPELYRYPIIVCHIFRRIPHRPDEYAPGRPIKRNFFGRGIDELNSLETLLRKNNRRKNGPSEGYRIRAAGEGQILPRIRHHRRRQHHRLHRLAPRIIRRRHRVHARRQPVYRGAVQPGFAPGIAHRSLGAGRAQRDRPIAGVGAGGRLHVVNCQSKIPALGMGHAVQQNEKESRVEYLHEIEFFAAGFPQPGAWHRKTGGCRLCRGDLWDLFEFKLANIFNLPITYYSKMLVTAGGRKRSMVPDSCPERFEKYSRRAACLHYGYGSQREPGTRSQIVTSIPVY